MLFEVLSLHKNGTVFSVFVGFKMHFNSENKTKKQKIPYNDDKLN